MKLKTGSQVWHILILGTLNCGIVNAAGSSIDVSLSKSSVYIDQASVPSFDAGSGSTLIVNTSLSLDKLFSVKGFSIEGEYSKSRTPISYEFSSTTTKDNKPLFKDTLTRNYEHQAIGGYIAFDFMSTQSLILKTRIGYAYSKASDKTIISCSGKCDERFAPVRTIGGINAIPDSRSLSGGGLSLGVSLSYAIFKHLFGVIEFTRLKQNYSGQDGEYGITYVGAGLGLRL